MKQEYIDHLIKRIGNEHLSKRLERQVERSAKFYSSGHYSHFHLENIKTVSKIIRYVLKMGGLYKRGINNSCQFRITKIKRKFVNLPDSFHGFKILHLSDLHSDGYEDWGQSLNSILKNISADLCVITGDFRYLDEHVHNSAIRLTKKIVKEINSKHGIYGILGNHDFIEFVPLLEDIGIKMLVNENVQLKSNNQSIWIAGIDDAHYYDCHDIPRSLKEIPENDFVVFLSHTPETYREASNYNVDYFLCGHTHGGQLCLPGEIMIFKNAKCPRKYCKGAWNYKGMKGYTSRGTGSSGLPVRYNSKPEVTIHELRIR